MADFVVLATADWDHPLWTNKQHTAVSLAELGHRVLYVESLGLRPPRPGTADLPRILKRFRRLLRLPRRMREGIWVWSPFVIPGASDPLSQRLNRLLVRRGLDLACRWIGFRTPILWTYNPLTMEVLQLSSFAGSVYHCVDRIQAQPEMPAERIDRAEQTLCQAVNAVFTTAPELQRALAPLNSHTHLFGNVADYEHFSNAWRERRRCPAELVDVPSPRLLFVGAIDAYKLHLPLLCNLARQRPDWSFVLVGPVGEADPNTDVKALQRCPNVHLPGPQPYAELPDWLAHGDVALLPLRLNSYTRNMFPMKFFEYLSAGLPVVASSIPSLQSHRQAALLVLPDAAEFEAAILAALADRGPSRGVRLALAEQHTYRSRTSSMLAVLELLGLMESPPLAGRRRPPELARALRREDGAAAADLIRRQWLHHGSLAAMHHQLFRRGARPRSRSAQRVLFESLAADDCFPPAEATYCRIALAYRLLEDRHRPRQDRCRVMLEPALETLIGDPSTTICQRSNRRNRAKLLVSVAITLVLLHAATADRQGMLRVSRQVAGWFDCVDLESLNSDAAFRMTRNLTRCLLVQPLSGVSTADTLQRFQRLKLFINGERHRTQSAQEDHRAILSSAMADLQKGSPESQNRLAALVSDEKHNLGLQAETLLMLLQSS